MKSKNPKFQLRPKKLSKKLKFYFVSEAEQLWHLRCSWIWFRGVLTKEMTRSWVGCKPLGAP